MNSCGGRIRCLLRGLHLLVVQGHGSVSRILTACDLGSHVLNRKTHKGFLTAGFVHT
jgi:hypothetical protein